MTDSGLRAAAKQFAEAVNRYFGRVKPPAMVPDYEALVAALAAPDCAGEERVIFGETVSIARDAFTDATNEHRHRLVRIINAAVDIVGRGSCSSRTLGDPRASITNDAHKIEELKMSVHDYLESLGMSSPASTVTQPQAGTVVVAESVLRNLYDAIQQAPTNYLTHEVVEAVDAIRPYLPKPLAPAEPSAELRHQWEVEYAKWFEAAFVDASSPRKTAYAAYLAAKLAAWRDGGKESPA